MNKRPTIYSLSLSQKRIAVAALCLILTACGSISRRNNEESKQADAAPPAANADAAAPGAEASPKDLNVMVAQLNKRMEVMDEKVATLTDKLAAAQNHLETMNSAQKTAGAKNATAVTRPLVDQAGIVPGAADDEPAQKAEFVTTPSIEKYRNGLILFEAGKFPEAMLEFNNFIKTYPDHPFAGSAQFYMGEAYYRQGEFKLASEEYQHVLSNYDQSSHVPDSLKRLSQCEDKLKSAKSAARHRQLLLSLFPQSPAAKEALEAKGLPAASDDMPIAPSMSQNQAQLKLHSKAQHSREGASVSSDSSDPYAAERAAAERLTAEKTAANKGLIETIQVQKEVSVGDVKFPATEGAVPTAPLEKTAAPTEGIAPASH